MQCQALQATVAKIESEAESTNVMTLTRCVILMWLCIVVGVGLGWKLHDAWCGDAHNVKKRTVKTQSQTHYAWSRVEPRFVPLAEKEQGVWHDVFPMPSVFFPNQRLRDV